MSFDTIGNINTLLSSGLDSAQFTETSFSNLSSVSVFDEAGYFAANPDVANAVDNVTGAGLNHYINFGQAEGRNDGSVDITELNNAINAWKSLTEFSTQIQKEDTDSEDTDTDQILHLLSST